MAWSTIRQATGEDHERLDAAARRFIERHLDEFPHLTDKEIDQDPAFAVAGQLLRYYGDSWEHQEKCRRLGRLWQRCVWRALRCRADGIAYGYVGQHVD